MDIEEVGSLQVVRSELSKVHFIKHNLIGMSDAPEVCDKGQNSHYCDGELVIPLFALLDLGRLVWFGLLDNIGDLLRHLFGKSFWVW